MVLRNLASQGILKVINGILVGKPQGEVYYEEYKDVIRQVISEEEGLKTLPILYNVNFGHAIPIGILPYGVEAEINCKDKTIKLMESATADE
jgi:muramoyltetrapeptide carboxypeptidase LdcA involved in peptidoglycan recycling